MVDEVEEKSAIEDDSALVKFSKAIQFSLDQPLERMADTFKSFGFEGTEEFFRDLIDAPENYLSASEQFMKNNGMGFSWEYLPRAVVEQLGSLVGNIGARAAGGAVLGSVAGPKGAIAGAIAGPVLFETLQILGPVVYERARNEGREEPILEDWLAAAPTTAISGFLGQRGSQGIANLNNIVKKTSLKNIGRGALEEGVTEGAQSLVEQTGTSAFTKSGFSLGGREALGEGIIGAGTGGGVNAITESGRLAELISNPSDSYLTVDEPKTIAGLPAPETVEALPEPKSADLTGVQLIPGQPKKEDLKRKTNVFRGSGLDVDVKRTGPESSIDYLNRLIQQEFKIPGLYNITYNDLRIKTPRLLAHELGIATRTVAFEDPTLSLTEEQQRELDEAYAEYESNNKINRLKKEIENLNYLSESEKAAVLREVDDAVEDAVGISGLYADLDEDVPLPTGVKATTEIIGTEGINLLKNLEYIDDFEFRDPQYYKHGGTKLFSRSRPRMIRDLVYKNPNLTDVEKELFIANQTWNVGGTYAGLEDALNLSYYKDNTNQQAYQRIPAEQLEVIKFLNDQYSSFQQLRLYGETFEDPSSLLSMFTDGSGDEGEYYGGNSVNLNSEIEKLQKSMAKIAMDARSNIFFGGDYIKEGPKEAFAEVMKPFFINFKDATGRGYGVTSSALEYHGEIGKEYFNADFIRPEIIEKSAEISNTQRGVLVPASHKFFIPLNPSVNVALEAYEGFEGFQAQQEGFEAVAQRIAEGDEELLEAFEDNVEQQRRMDDIIDDAIPDRNISRTNDRDEAYEKYVKSLANKPNPQIAYAQHFVNAFNPYFNPSTRFSMFNDDTYSYGENTGAYEGTVESISEDLGGSTGNDFDYGYDSEQAMIYSQADYFLTDDPTDIYERMKEALDLFNNEVTAPRLREDAKREVFLNFQKAKFLFDRQEMEREFEDAFINYYLDLAEKTGVNMVEDTIAEDTLNLLNQISAIDPETANDLRPQVEKKLAGLKSIAPQVLEDAKASVTHYMQDHMSEFRGQDADEGTLPEKIMALLKNSVLGTDVYKDEFGFLNNALQSIAFTQKYDPSNIIAGRDVSRTKFWDFLKRNYPELFRNNPQLAGELPMYQDTVAEINITEANNSPFATPVDPVFMSSYFVNENIQKLIPGKPYDAEAMLEFLITPHSAEKPIYPETTESSLEPVIDPKTNEPKVNPKTGEVIYKAVRSSEEKSKSAKELFGVANKPDINDDFKDTARKELVTTGLASFLALRHARNRPVTKEELETLLMHNANKTLMTVNSNIKTQPTVLTEKYLNKGREGPYGSQDGSNIHSQSADNEVFRQKEIENFTFNLFNDYPKPKMDMENLMLDPAITRDKVKQINNPYGGRTEDGGKLNQYSTDRGHPFGVAWLRASVIPTYSVDTSEADLEIPIDVEGVRQQDILIDKAGSSLRFFKADPTTGKVETKILGDVFIAKESQNDNEEFRAEGAQKLTEATFPFALKRFKTSLQKLLPNHPITKKIVEEDEYKKQYKDATQKILNSDLGIVPGRAGGTATERVEEAKFAEAVADFFMPIVEGDPVRGDGRNYQVFYSDYNNLLEQSLHIKDHLVSNVGPDGITLLPYEDFKRNNSLERQDANKYTLQNAPYQKLAAALFAAEEMQGMHDATYNVLHLAHMYGAAQNVTENNLGSLALLIDPFSPSSSAQERNPYQGSFRINSEDGVYKWLVGGYATRKTALPREFHPTNVFIQHARVIDLLERQLDLKDNFLRKDRFDTEMTPIDEKLEDFVARLNENKDSGAYEFLKSVTPPPDFTTDDRKAVEKEAKRIWKNWQKAVEEFKKYTPAIPMLAATKNYPLYKNVAKKDIQHLNLREDIKKQASAVGDAVGTSTIEQPYVGLAQNPFNSPILREQLGQDYSKLSTRMSLKFVVENLYPNVTSYVVPSRFVNQMHGQYHGAHENFDKMKRELYKIAKTFPGAEVEPLVYLRQGVQKTMTDNEINEDGPTIIRKTTPKDLDFEKVKKKLIKEIKNDNVKFKHKTDALENPALLNELTKILIENPLELQAIGSNGGIGIAYSLDLEPLVVEDPSTPSGFSLKKVFRGHKLGGLVGKGIVGLRNEIYNSLL